MCQTLHLYILRCCRDDEAAAQRRQLAERSALAAFWEASREATGLLVSAERSRRAAAR